MRTDSEALIRRAFCEILADESAVLEKPAVVPFTRSQNYRERWKQILCNPENAVKKSISARTRVALLIAAALLAALLTACAVFHEQIGNFFVDRRSGHCDVSSNIGEFRIQTRYYPTYLPQGYHLSSSHIYESTSHFLWESEDNQIVFEQTALACGTSSLDSNSPDAGTTTLAERQVLYVKRNGYFSCLWEDGNYSYFLMCPSSLPDEEIERIILSIAEYNPETNE